MVVLSGYGIIGSGKVAKHFQRYFEYLKIPFRVYDRSIQTASHSDILEDCSHILILVKDDAIASVFDQISHFPEKIFYHCSGALAFSEIKGAHPLMTFGQQLYSEEFYREIPFIYDHSPLPGLPNPQFYLSAKQKQLYHCLCVLGGNLPYMLWLKVSELIKDLDLPLELFIPFFRQSLNNFELQGAKGLTGPFVRNDRVVIQGHIDSLGDDPFKKVYEAFWEAYLKEHKSREDSGFSKV